jgi:putative iron-only hydrogenase system regulator
VRKDTDNCDTYIDKKGENMEDKRVTLIGIMVEDTASAQRVNGLLHEYQQHIIGRMGIPYREKNINVISVVMDAPQSVVSALSGKLGMLPGVSSKCLYGKR